MVRQCTSDRPWKLKERGCEALSILGEQGPVREPAIQSLFSKMSELSSLAEYHSHICTMIPPVFVEEGAPAAVDVPPECTCPSNWYHSAPPECICHTQHREAGEVDARRDVICPMCGAAKDTVEHLQLGFCCYTADERWRMYEKRLLREREDMSDEVKEELIDTLDEVKEEIDE